jgi:hypothetical protein
LKVCRVLLDQRQGLERVRRMHMAPQGARQSQLTQAVHGRRDSFGAVDVDGEKEQVLGARVKPDATFDDDAEVSLAE